MTHPTENFFPPSAEAVSALIERRKNSSHKKCAICYDFIPSDPYQDLIKHKNMACQCDYCPLCFEDYTNNLAFSTDFQTDVFTIPCQICKKKIHLDIANIILGESKYQNLLSKIKLTFHKNEEEITCSDPITQLVNQALEHINPKCPSCKKPFCDFDACCAVHCPCGKYFCAWCMEFSDSDNKTHSHVLYCPRSLFPRELFPRGDVVKVFKQVFLVYSFEKFHEFLDKIEDHNIREKVYDQILAIEPNMDPIKFDEESLTFIKPTPLPTPVAFENVEPPVDPNQMEIELLNNEFVHIIFINLIFVSTLEDSARSATFIQELAATNRLIRVGNRELPPIPVGNLRFIFDNFESCVLTINNMNVAKIDFLVTPSIDQVNNFLIYFEYHNIRMRENLTVDFFNRNNLGEVDPRDLIPVFFWDNTEQPDGSITRELMAIDHLEIQ